MRPNSQTAVLFGLMRRYISAEALDSRAQYCFVELVTQSNVNVGRHRSRRSKYV